MQKRWQCSVCGYIHEGDAPPDTCPVCGADRSQFTLVEEGHTGFLAEMVTAFRLHPVLAHFPNGLTPTALLLLILWLITGEREFEIAAFTLLPILIAVVPFSIASGLRDWHIYFSGERTPIFFRKLGLALALLLLGLGATALRHSSPELLTSTGWQRWAYLACLAGMLGCVTLLGHFGTLLATRVAVRKGTDSATTTATTGDIEPAWFQAIVTQAPDAILAADAEGIIRLWNRGAERIFGLSADRAVGQSLDLIIPEKLRERHWQGWDEAMRTGTSRYGKDQLLQVPALRGDGGRFSAEFSLVILHDANQTITGVAAILRDVTEQWEREQEFKKRSAGSA